MKIIDFFVAVIVQLFFPSNMNSEVYMLGKKWNLSTHDLLKYTFGILNTLGRIYNKGPQ